MKKFFCYGMGMISVITGICFLYMFFTGQYNSTLVLLGFECCISTVFFIMLEERPRKTEAQIRHDDRIKGQGLSLLLLIAIAAVVITFASSCSPKYGCGHGAPKQSWNKMVNRINRGY